MSSLVLEVLATTAKMSTADLTEKANEIHKEIANLKNQVKAFIEDNYVDFLPTLKSYHSLVSQSLKLTDEMKTLQCKIEEEIKVDLSGSTKELKNLLMALEESTIALKLSGELLELNECFKESENHKQNQRYVEAAKVFKRIQEVLNNTQSDLQLLDIYSSLEEHYYNSYASLLTTVTKLWEKYVFWTVEESDGKKNSLMINCEPGRMSEIVLALYNLDEFIICLHHFSNKLVKYIIKPIIHSECSVFVDNEKIFNVEIVNDNVRNSYEIVLYNLKLLFQFIRQHFNIQIEDHFFINYLNENIWKQVADDLVDNCIFHVIPNSMGDLKKFCIVEKNIHDLEDYLIEIGFIVKEDEYYLSNYIKDVDSLYVDKKCQDLLSKATEIMKKDLHDSFKYEPIESTIDLYEGLESKLPRSLSKSSFYLPTCQISKSTKELLDLVRDTLDEAILSPDIPMSKLYYTTRNVFEAYLWIVPEYHSKFLETIPQQVALFHNNCMYLAHNLMTLAHEYRDRLPEDLQKHNIIYVDLTLKLRSIGVDFFLNHIKYQKNIILNILKESGLSQLSQELSKNTERAFRQCIRQLELLKTVWLNVLPINVYSKSLSCILNSMIEDVVFKVTSVEDISASAATDLANLFSMIVKRIPLIFPVITTLLLINFSYLLVCFT